MTLKVEVDFLLTFLPSLLFSQTQSEVDEANNRIKEFVNFTEILKDMTVSMNTKIQGKASISECVRRVHYDEAVTALGAAIDEKASSDDVRVCVGRMKVRDVMYSIVLYRTFAQLVCAFALFCKKIHDCHKNFLIIIIIILKKHNATVYLSSSSSQNHHLRNRNK